MNQKDGTLFQEDISKLAKAFKWLVDEDRKQNPHLYKKQEINH